MLTEKEIHLIKSYYIRLSLALPCIIGAFLPAVPFVVCAFVNHLFGDGVSYVNIIWIYPISVAVLLILFSYCMLSVRFGMMSKKWKVILDKTDSISMDPLDPRKAAMANATRAMGNLTGSKVTNVAGGVETVGVAYEYTHTMLGNVKRVANAFQIRYPKVGFYQFLCIILSSVLVIGSFVPVLIGSYNEGNDAIKAREVVFEKYNQAFTGMDYGMDLSDKSSNTVSFRFSDQQDRRKYITIEGNRYGEFKAFNIIYPLDTSLSPKENMEGYRTFVHDMEEKLKSSDMDLQALNDTSFVSLLNDVAKEYESKSENEEIFNQNEMKDIDVSLSSNIEGDNSYFYFSIQLES